MAVAAVAVPVLGKRAFLTCGSATHRLHNGAPLAGAVDEAWRAHDSPNAWLREVVEDFGPELIVTLDHIHGFTGHLEHQVAGLAAYRVATNQEIPAMWVLNHYEAFEPFIGEDVMQPTEEWDVARDCGGVTCRDATVAAAEHHASQTGSILTLVLSTPDLFDVSYLRVEAAPALMSDEP